MKTIKYISLVLCCFFFSAVLQAQDLRTVLDQILQNNQQLKLAAKTAERMKIESSIGLLPADPEVEFGYMWGEPTAIGNKKDFSIRQSFEFPTVYAQRAKYSRLQKTMGDYFYQNEKQKVTAEVLRLMIEIIHQNKLKKTLQQRLEDAEKIKRMTNKLLEEGEVGMLDKDKADLQFLNLENQVSLCQTAIDNLNTELSRLNGNQPLRIASTDYPAFLAIKQFENLKSLFFEKDAKNSLLRGEQEVSEQQLKLSAHEYLPGLSVAYASESVLDENMRGIKAGIRIPLWHKKNTLKLSKISIEEKEAEMVQFSQNKKAEWNQLWLQYTNYQKRVGAMKALLERIVPNKSLVMAFELGEISLLDYITESAFYYDSYDSYLELEKESFLKAVELKKVELAQ